jgi:hypothetical protein
MVDAAPVRSLGDKRGVCAAGGHRRLRGGRERGKLQRHSSEAAKQPAGVICQRRDRRLWDKYGAPQHACQNQSAVAARGSDRTATPTLQVGCRGREKNHCSTTQLAMYHCCNMHRGRLQAPDKAGPAGMRSTRSAGKQRLKMGKGSAWYSKRRRAKRNAPAMQVPGTACQVRDGSS